PVAYIWGRTGIGFGRAFGYGLQFLGAAALFHSLVLLLIAAAASTPHGLRRMLPRRQDLVLIALVVTPIVLTILFGLIFGLKISSNMTVGTFPLLPLLVMRLAPAPDPWRLYRCARILVITITAAALLASPLVADVVFSGGSDPDAIEPRQEIAYFVTQLWHDHAQTPLRIVT